MIRKCMSIDISFSFTTRNGPEWFHIREAVQCELCFHRWIKFLKKKVGVFEQYFLHIRAFHSYDKLDQSTWKSSNSWLEI